MVIRGSYIFEFSVCKDMEKENNNDKRRIPTYLLTLCFLHYLLTLIVEELKIIVE